MMCQSRAIIQLFSRTNFFSLHVFLRLSDRYKLTFMIQLFPSQFVDFTHLQQILLILVKIIPNHFEISAVTFHMS